MKRWYEKKTKSRQKVEETRVCILRRNSTKDNNGIDKINRRIMQAQPPKNRNRQKLRNFRKSGQKALKIGIYDLWSKKYKRIEDEKL